MEKTQDYSQFKIMHGNREINQFHVDSLVQVIQKNNLLQFFPLLVNEHMQLIDGQHRLAAADALGVDVWFVVIPGLTLEDVMSINTHSKGWTLEDFIEAYIKSGKKDYVELIEFSRGNNLSLTVSARLLYGFDFRGPDTMGRIIRDGRFTIKHREFAELLVDQATRLQQFAEFEIKKDRNFLAALSQANRSDAFDFDTFIGKLTLHNQRIISKHNTRYYVLEIEEIYNFRNRIYIDIYASSRNRGKKIDKAVDTMS